MTRTLLPIFLMLAFCAACPAQSDAAKDKALLEQVCGACHSVDVVTAQRSTKAGWEATVDSMLARGATATDEEVKQIVAYLTAAFGKPQNIAAIR